MLRLKTYCIVMVLLVPLCLHAQDFAADMKKSSEAYLEQRKFSMTVQAQVFSSLTSKSPDQVMLSYVKKYGDSYKTITDYVETLYNPKYVIAISKPSKTIMYAPNNKKTPDLKEVFPLVDSALADYDSVVYKGIVNGDKFYKIFVSSGAVQEVEIYLRPDFLFSKITYVCSPGQSIYKMETIFKDIQVNAELKSAQFDTDFYLNQTNPKRISPSKAYIGYRVIYNDFALRNKL